MLYTEERNGAVRQLGMALYAATMPQYDAQATAYMLRLARKHVRNMCRCLDVTPTREQRAAAHVTAENVTQRTLAVYLGRALVYLDWRGVRPEQSLLVAQYSITEAIRMLEGRDND